MSTNTIKQKESLIHKIREIDLERIVIEDHYDVVKEIGSGDYGKVVLAIHRRTGTQVSILFHSIFMSFIDNENNETIFCLK